MSCFERIAGETQPSVGAPQRINGGADSPEGRRQRHDECLNDSCVINPSLTWSSSALTLLLSISSFPVSAHFVNKHLLLTHKRVHKDLPASISISPESFLSPSAAL